MLLLFIYLQIQSSQILFIIINTFIALFVAIIAWQQTKINRDKLRLDLFEKRYALFKHLKELMLKIIREKGVHSTVIIEHYNCIQEGEFLFDKEVYEFINEVTDKNIKLEVIKRSLEHSEVLSFDNRNKLIEERKNIIDSLITDFGRIEGIFKNYLLFNNVKISNLWSNVIKSLNNQVRFKK